MGKMLGRTRLLTAVAVLVGFLSLSGFAHGDPIVVNYAVSGSESDWLVNFSVTNTIGGGFDAYALAVQLPEGNIAGSPFPSGLWVTIEGSIPASVWGGSDTIYNLGWEANSAVEILDGTTLGGFMAHTTTSSPPAFVNWVVLAHGPVAYTGPSSFVFPGNPRNPGFEGTATPSSAPIPEPTSLLLVGPGLIAIAVRYHRRRRAAVRRWR
jgi:PEP-CTERM motif